MTLGDILSASKLSGDELTKRIAFRNMKNSIDDCISMYKRNFLSVIEDSIKGIVSGTIYNSGCCGYNQNNPEYEISDDDRKELINKVKEQSEKTLKDFKDIINSFEDTKSDEPEKKEIEVNIQVQKPEEMPTIASPVVNRNYFGY